MTKTAEKPKLDPKDQLTFTKQTEQTEVARMAEVAYDPAARAVGVGRNFMGPTMGVQPAQESYQALEAQIAQVRKGNLSGLEKTLVAQANTLDAIFNEMARRAAINAGTYIETMDVYMRLALKAQSQCRTTIEALAMLKNPPVVIAKQANVTTGPQQINNGAATTVPALPQKPDLPVFALQDGPDSRGRTREKSKVANPTISEGP